VTADIYCKQLDRMSAKLKIKRPRLVNKNQVILLHDNARPHTAQKTRQKIKELGYEILPHPAYSPDIAPSDYYLFRSLQHHLKGQRFASIEAIKKTIKDFFDKKDITFYRKGIEDLVNKWTHVIENDGHYIIN
jgi:[histone H3]-lysine36 N-dimethyltransferase SETMAR